MTSINLIPSSNPVVHVHFNQKQQQIMQESLFVRPQYPELYLTPLYSQCDTSIYIVVDYKYHDVQSIVIWYGSSRSDLTTYNT